MHRNRQTNKQKDRQAKVVTGRRIMMQQQWVI